MGFDAGTGVSVCNAVPAEAAGRLAAVSVASYFVAFLIFFFAIVFPFVCRIPMLERAMMQISTPVSRAGLWLWHDRPQQRRHHEIQTFRRRMQAHVHQFPQAVLVLPLFRKMIH